MHFHQRGFYFVAFTVGHETGSTTSIAAASSGRSGKSPPWVSQNRSGSRVSSVSSTVYAPLSHMHGERSSEVDELFDGHRNLSNVRGRGCPYLLGKKGFSDERLPRAARKWTLLGRPVAYIKVALSNVTICLLYIKGWREGKNGCANDAMSGRVDDVIMRDIRGVTWGFLCLAEETTLHPRQWAADAEGRMKFLSCDCRIRYPMVSIRFIEGPWRVKRLSKRVVSSLRFWFDSYSCNLKLEISGLGCRFDDLMFGGGCRWSPASTNFCTESSGSFQRLASFINDDHIKFFVSELKPSGIVKSCKDGFAVSNKACNPLLLPFSKLFSQRFHIPIYCTCWVHEATLRNAAINDWVNVFLRWRAKLSRICWL